jgi:hypothetical protein
VFEEWVGEASVFGFEILPQRKSSALKHMAGALPTDGVGCTLSVGREVEMEIPDKGTWNQTGEANFRRPQTQVRRRRWRALG